MVTHLPQPVSWIPLDAIGSMYLDLLTSDETLPSVINVVHPRPTTWKEMLHGIWEELGASLPFVTLEEWVKRLDALPTAVSNEELQKIVSDRTPYRGRLPLTLTS